jgi:hypothetical protein
MAFREVLASVLAARFADRDVRVGASPGPIATFPAKHPHVGDVTVAETSIEWTFTVIVKVGEIVTETFHNFDNHLEPDERVVRLTNDLVRFLHELFADRLLIWRSTDGRDAGWRERGDVGYSEPLVLDNRSYQTYLWSGPLAVWQAVPAVFGRGRIQDEREYEIVTTLLEEEGPDALDEAEREVARQLVADYKRERGV